jgi:dolichyl-phosphate-mannose-protein mannosyltransferase
VKVKFGLEIGKRDLLIMALLTVVFLAMALPNLGLTKTPTTIWEANDAQTVQLDLGSSQHVKTVYFLVKEGGSMVYDYSGSPPNWSLMGGREITNGGYYAWQDLALDVTTRYIQLSFNNGSIQIAEIAILGNDNQQIPIVSAASENGTNPNKLVDEQNYVQIPPTYMSQTYFDEIYFAQSAQQYLHGQVPMEWTHPPLGKLIIAFGITVFGFDPFGWRIMGVLFAAAMIPFIYLLGKKLFGTWIGGFSAAFLLTFDFMHFVMARMGTADTFLVFFSVISQLFFLIYLKNVLKDGWKTSIIPLFLAVLFFTLSFSVKWIALYGFLAEIAILAVLRLREVLKLKSDFSEKFFAFFDHPYSYLVCFILVAISLYFIIYIPDMINGRSILNVISLQGSMYGYHAFLTATHPYASPWYSWPFLVNPFNSATHVPLFLSLSSLPDGMKSTIVLLGNPAVWWVGFTAVIAVAVLYIAKTVYRAVKKQNVFTDLPAVFIVVFFFFQWVPYVLISRVTFVYHFYLDVPFLILGSTYFINKVWMYKWGKIVTVIYFALVVGLFVLFYPAISGNPAPIATINHLKWFGSWVF